MVGAIVLCLFLAACGGENGDDAPADDAEAGELRELAGTSFELLAAGDRSLCELLTPDAEQAVVRQARAYARGVEVDAGEGSKLELDRGFYRGVDSCEEAIERSGRQVAADQATVDFTGIFREAEVEISDDDATVAASDSPGDPSLVVPFRMVGGEWLIDQLQLAPPPFVD